MSYVVVAVVGVAAVSTAYSIYSAEETKKNNAAIQKKAEEQQKKLETEALDEKKKKKATEERDMLVRQLDGEVNDKNKNTYTNSMPTINSIGASNSGTTILGG